MAREQRILVGQVVAITGGARGIGKATAQRLAREGMKVSIGDLDGDLAEEVAGHLGGGAIGMELDVTDVDSFSDFIEATEEQLGPIDVLINNAGIMQLGPFIEEDLATTERMININVYGVHYGCKLVLPKMVARRRGHLVNIASVAGTAGFSNGVTYCGTKHYVRGMSEGLYSELRGTGIDVSCVMPVAVHTELGAGLPEPRGVKMPQPEDVAEEICLALKEPRFDVFVPRSVGTLQQVMSILPRGGRERMTRAMKADQVLATADMNARRDYELRAARSAPAIETGKKKKKDKKKAKAAKSDD
ncbi:MAG: SDR family oxidoreductase [Acidobacteria bacterium]|nr:SDR family oxidoreductase [Solirubrobacteraceae bacterium]MBU6337339.1 SDR family oxidoreductase [Acidobacteriota bacterium]